MDDIALEQLLLQAVMSQRGLIISTSDVELLKRKLYVIRNAARKQGKDLYDSLSFRTSPRPNELFIVKKESENAKE